MKTRISKKARIRFSEQAKISSYKAKKTVIPGPWTNHNTSLAVCCSLFSSSSVIPSLGSFRGVYKDVTDWNEKGWYPITINITFPNYTQTRANNSLDDLLAACEKDLNQQGIYGHIVLTYLVSDNPKFLSMFAKTNKKHILGFLAIRSGVLSVLR